MTGMTVHFTEYDALEAIQRSLKFRVQKEQPAMPLKQIGLLVKDPALQIERGGQTDTREGEADKVFIEVKGPLNPTKHEQQQDDSTGHTYDPETDRR